MEVTPGTEGIRQRSSNKKEDEGSVSLIVAYFVLSSWTPGMNVTFIMVP